MRQVTFGGYGEPLAHPRFPEVVARIAELGVEVVLTTNGLLLDRPMAERPLDAGLGRVIVSLDTVHIQAYARARVITGVNHLDNMRTLREKAWQRGRTIPRIGMEFGVMRSNLEWLSRLPQLARELEDDSVLVSNLPPHTEEMVQEILYDRDEPLPASTGWPVPSGDLALWGIVHLPRLKWGARWHCRLMRSVPS